MQLHHGCVGGCGNQVLLQTKDANRRNAFDQARIGTLGIKPKYITEVFVDKENAEMALHIVHTLPNQENFEKLLTVPLGVGLSY